MSQASSQAPSSPTAHETITDLAELQWRLIFSVIVAGKTAAHAYAATGRIFRAKPPEMAAFAFLQIVASSGPALGDLLRKARTGNYGKLERAVRELLASKIDLTSCSPADLESIHGIGPKTARFFVIWTRPTYRCAALDVHVLRWLRANGYPDAPEASPSAGAVYDRYEKAFLAEADKRSLSPRALDYEIWSAANVGGIK